KSSLAFAALGVLALLGGLMLVAVLDAAHQRVYAAVLLGLIGLSVWVYVSPRAYAWRYVVPGAGAALVFIVFPMVYTFIIGFTNYSSDNLLSFERATDVLIERGIASGASMEFKVFGAG